MEEAKKYLINCAKLNGRPMSEDSLSQEVSVLMCKREYTGVGREFMSECPSSWAHHIQAIYDQLSSGEL